MDLIKLNKTNQIKTVDGDTLLRYICKSLISQKPDFPVRMNELTKLFKDNFNTTNLEEPYTRVSESFHNAKCAYLEVCDLQEQGVKSDYFKDVAGKYISNKAAADMDKLE